MAWTAPMTFVTATALTAAQLNTYLRDNLLETEACKAQTPGALMVSTAANACAERTPAQASNTAIGTRSNAAYGNLNATANQDNPGVGPVASTVTGDTALGIWSVQSYNTTSGAFARCSVAVSGATTLAANDQWEIVNQKTNATGVDNNTYIQLMQAHLFKSGNGSGSALTPGTNTFTMQYKSDTGAGFWQVRRLIIIPF